MKIKYTTWGPVDGSCDHSHPTMSLAKRCLEKYHANNHLSDRLIMAVENGKRRLLNSHETLEHFGKEKE